MASWNYKQGNISGTIYPFSGSSSSSPSPNLEFDFKKFDFKKINFEDVTIIEQYNNKNTANIIVKNNELFDFIAYRNLSEYSISDDGILSFSHYESINKCVINNPTQSIYFFNFPMSIINALPRKVQSTKAQPKVDFSVFKDI